MRTGEFREWLGEICCREYVADGGLDDGYTDHEADWFAELDPEDVIEWAEKLGELRYLDGEKAGIAWGIEQIKR